MKKNNKNLIRGCLLFLGILFSFGFFVNYSLAYCSDNSDCGSGYVCDMYYSWNCIPGVAPEPEPSGDDSHAVDGPVCVNKTLQKCDAWCTESGAWCDATTWSASCSGSWYDNNGYQNPVECCNDSDCSGGETCNSSNVCVSSIKITSCSGDSQSYKGLDVEYSDGSSSTYRSIALSYGGTGSSGYDPPAGEIRTYSCGVGDSEVSSQDSDCGCGTVNPCEGPAYTACAHGVTASADNYWNSTYGYCGLIPGSCSATCIPDNSICAANTCIGESCHDGCNWISGTMDCDSSLPEVSLMISDGSDLASIDIGYPVDLVWKVKNADSCEAEAFSSGAGDWSGSKDPTDGTFRVTPTSDGYYSYRLTCSNSNGSSEDYTYSEVDQPANSLPIAVIDQPVDDISVDIGESFSFQGHGVEGQYIVFIFETHPDIISYKWSLGNCGVADSWSNDSSYNHTFNTPGTYEVYLSVLDDRGRASVNCPSRTITVGAPTCTAFYDKESINSGEDASMTWTSANDADNRLEYSCTNFGEPSGGDWEITGHSGTITYNGNGRSGTINSNNVGLATWDSLGNNTSETCTFTAENSLGQKVTCSDTLFVNAPSFSCTDIPNATVCPSDDILNDATSSTVVEDGNCSSPEGSDPKCEYICDTGFIKNGNSCDPITCLLSDPSNTNMCPGDGATTISVNKTLKGSCSDPEGSDPKCEYICKEGYRYDSDSGTCELIPTTRPVNWQEINP